jgi:hypothetical protein
VAARRESALCKRVWDRFEERSSAALAATEALAGAPVWIPPAARTRKSWGARVAQELVLLAAEPRDEPAA